MRVTRHPHKGGELQTFELSTQAHQAHLAGTLAAMTLSRILHNADTISQMIIGEVNSRAVQANALAHLDDTTTDAVQLVNTLRELVAQHCALIAMLQKAIGQRDEALMDQAGWLDDLVDRIAQNQMCPREQAYKLLTVLLNSDENVMIDDVVIGLDNLIAFRDELAPLLDILDTDMSMAEDYDA